MMSDVHPQVEDFNAIKLFYKQVFPIELLFKWLCNGRNDSEMGQREISITYPDQVVHRHEAYAEPQLLRSKFSDWKIPLRVDIGSIRAEPFVKARFKEWISCPPVGKEFVIDVDVDDYVPYRRCSCPEKEVCAACWKFIAVAVEVMDVLDGFGWIRDASVMGCANLKRALICRMLEPRKQLMPDPTMDELVNVIQNRWNDLLSAHDFLTSIPSSVFSEEEADLRRAVASILESDLLAPSSQVGRNHSDS